MEQVTLTRRELYDLVWSTPMTAIAKKYLISDVGSGLVPFRFRARVKERHFLPKTSKRNKRALLIQT